MTKKIIRLSEETGKEEQYNIVYLEEEVSIKGQIFNVSHEYYKRESDKELFAPFDNPDKNLDLDFNKYREENGLLSSMEIKEVRNSYELSTRDFANILGVSYSTLSSVENGSLQSDYLNSLVELASDPYALKKLVIKYQRNKKLLSTSKYKSLCRLLNEKIVNSYVEHKEVAVKIYNLQYDLHNKLTVIENKIDYDISIRENNKEGSEENWGTSIIRSIPKVLPKLKLKN